MTVQDPTGTGQGGSFWSGLFGDATNAVTAYFGSQKKTPKNTETSGNANTTKLLLIGGGLLAAVVVVILIIRGR